MTKSYKELQHMNDSITKIYQGLIETPDFP